MQWVNLDLILRGSLTSSVSILIVSSESRSQETVN